MVTMLSLTLSAAVPRAGTQGQITQLLDPLMWDRFKNLDQVRGVISGGGGELLYAQGRGLGDVTGVAVRLSVWAWRAAWALGARRA